MALTVATFNIQHGLSNDGLYDLNYAIRTIAAINPDIVGVQELTTIKPPETLIAQHAMLVQSSTLAIMATTLLTEAIRTGDVNIRKNAASAAAGALLLLQRACGDLRCN